MFRIFINHQWQEAKRSPVWQKNVAINLFIGFLFLLMAFYLLMVGLLIDRILADLYPGRNTAEVFNGFLLLYFLADIVIRFYLQPVSVFHIDSYLHLPIPKRTIVHYVEMKTVLSIFNIIPFLVVVPFAFIVIARQYSPLDAWIYLGAIFLLVMTNNFFATYLKRQLSSRPKIVALAGLIVIGLILFNYFDLLSISGFSSRIFGYLLIHPWLICVPALLLVLVYTLHYFFLKKRLYSEEIETRKKQKLDSLSEIRYLKGLGITGEIIALEMKLMWRNKRPKTTILLFPLFILYGLFFYPQEINMTQGTGMLIFVGVFMTGGMMLNYLNYAFGWESHYFDALLTSRIDMDRYLRVKFINSLIISTLCFIVTIPYVLFGWKILLINFVTYVYNIGFLSFVLLYMATFNRKRIDLSRGSAFNYQGIGASNWLAMIPAFLFPPLVYWPFHAMGLPYAGFIIIGVIGLLGLSFSRILLQIIRNHFEKRRYIMAEGFRVK
ncbi:MAG: DUF5687 family protein [Bacteroidales bacterium]|nr:hypothetical protein [Lentimicrobiaceae bacterium]MDD5694323.1 DUF5687 family protein [Bacteroidales bacterium]